ncbi:hypothetical protein HPB50_000274 [Hyalomma asiaticum]|uniref:Uncharacterized protein n=1 Tax=Hyalomma asiaticum TaxID=266040 RepID=A0ACB7S5U5_HYAAI|nr:hypothetical protein HPB50_000274 [Hyalomma asiaticum]
MMAAELARGGVFSGALLTSGAMVFHAPLALDHPDFPRMEEGEIVSPVKVSTRAASAKRVPLQPQARRHRFLGGGCTRCPLTTRFELGGRLVGSCADTPRAVLQTPWLDHPEDTVVSAAGAVALGGAVRVDLAFLKSERKNELGDSCSTFLSTHLCLLDSMASKTGQRGQLLLADEKEGASNQGDAARPGRGGSALHVTRWPIMRRGPLAKKSRDSCAGGSEESQASSRVGVVVERHCARGAETDTPGVRSGAPAPEEVGGTPQCGGRRRATTQQHAARRKERCRRRMLSRSGLAQLHEVGQFTDGVLRERPREAARRSGFGSACLRASSR